MGVGRISYKEFIILILFFLFILFTPVPANSVSDNDSYKEIHQIITTPITSSQYRSLPNPLPDINFITEKDGQSLQREDNIFVPGSTLKVKITTPIIDNRYRLVAMDYVMVVTDPFDNIIYLDIVEDRSISYTTESTAVFSKKIPTTWLDGEYLIELYSYDRVDTTELKDLDFDIYDKDEKIDDLSDFFDEDPSDDILEDLEVLDSRSHSTVVKDTLTFFINKNSNPIKVQNLSVNQKIVPINSSVLVTVQIENTVTSQRNTAYELFLNDRHITRFDPVLGSREWQSLNYEIINAPVGENSLRLGSKTVNFSVSETPLGPTQLHYLDIFTRTSKLFTEQEFDISVTALNTGRKGSMPIVLSVNDQEIIQNVELDYGEKKTIDYQILINKSGTYTARITGTELSKVLFIQEIPIEVEEEEEKSPIFTFAIIFYFFILVLILLGLWKYRRSRQSSETPPKKKLEVDSCQRIKVILNQIVPDTVARYKSRQSEKNEMYENLDKKRTRAYTLLEKCPSPHYSSGKIEKTFKQAYNELKLNYPYDNIMEDTTLDPLQDTMVFHKEKSINGHISTKIRNMVEKDIDYSISDIPLGSTNVVFLDLFFTNRCRFYAGDVFNIFITLINTGSKGSKSIKLLVNDEILYKDVELDYGEKITIQYDLQITESGVYTARIAGTNLLRNFFIQQKLSITENLQPTISVT